MSKFTEFYKKVVADEAANKELGDDEMEAAAGGACHECFHFDSTEDWWYVACEVKKDGSNIEEVAARHEIDPSLLKENWQFFMRLHCLRGDNYE